MLSCVWKDAGVLGSLKSFLWCDLSYLGPVSCAFSPWVSSGFTVGVGRGVAAAAESDDFVAGITFWGFPGGSDCKESACHAGDPCSVPGLGRFPGEGDGYSLQLNCKMIFLSERLGIKMVYLLSEFWLLYIWHFFLSFFSLLLLFPIGS